MTDKKDLIPRAIQLQKEAMAKDGHFISERALAKILGVSKSWVQKRVPKEYRQTGNVTSQVLLAQSLNIEKMLLAARKHFDQTGVPYSQSELAEAAGVSEAWIHRHAKLLPSELKRAQPSEFKTYTKDVPPAIEVAAKEMSAAIRATPNGKNTISRDILRQALVASLSTAVQDGILSCPSHPDAHLVWSCGDPLKEAA